MASLITLTTDFGLTDAYVASLKGVILTINPEAKIVDISHTIEPQCVLQAGFILANACHYFPVDVIHLLVVDPGVGSDRRNLILRTEYAYFIVPDNGALSYIVDEAFSQQETSSNASSKVLKKAYLPKGKIEAVDISNPLFWRQPVSSTFHGRDILAPVAAHLSLGIPMSNFGDHIDFVYAFPIAKPHYTSDSNLVGEILHIDHFGVLITNFTERDLPGAENIRLTLGNTTIIGLSHFYCEKSGLVVLWGSSGYLEIALPDGNAAVYLEAAVGNEVRLELDHGFAVR